MKRFIVFLALLCCFSLSASAQIASSINPNLPAPNDPVDSATIRNLALAAYTDITQLFSQVNLPSLGANQLLLSLVSGIPSGYTMPACNGSNQAIIFTQGAGFGCNTFSFGGLGTVTAVGIIGDGVTYSSTPSSPVTTSGNLAFTPLPQLANTFLRGPNSGATGASFWGPLVGLDLPTPTTLSLGGVKSTTPVSHQFLTGIDTSGAPSQTQPAFTDISGVATAAQIPNPSASSIGGVQSIASVSHNFLTSISTLGVPTQAQPAFTDISGTSTVSQGGTGVSNPTAHAVMLGEGASAMTPLAPSSTTGWVLTSNGPSADPSYQAIVGGGVSAISGDGFFTNNSSSTGAVTLTKATHTQNSIIGAATSTAAADLAVPSCSGASNALTWQTGVGIGCNTISPGGSGTVNNSSSANAISYYATTGTAVSPTTGIFINPTTGGLNFANTTTGNAISLGNSGTDTTSLGVGLGALSVTNTGNLHNTAIGDGAMASVTSYGDSVAVGYQALGNAQWNTQGGRSVAIGYQALRGVTTGNTPNDMVAIGYGAGNQGAASVFIGYMSGHNELVGGSVGIGYETLQNAVSCNYNIAIGENALFNLACSNTNAYNTAVGQFAGINLTTGLGNTILGGSGINTAPLTTGSNNLILGGGGVGTTTLASGSRNILIGTNNAIDTTTSSASNEIHMGGSGGDWVFVSGTNNQSTQTTQFYGNGVALGAQTTPADNATCTAGTFWWDTGFIYVCTASGTVKRAALSTY